MSSGPSRSASTSPSTRSAGSRRTSSSRPSTPCSAIRSSRPRSVPAARHDGRVHPRHAGRRGRLAPRRRRQRRIDHCRDLEQRHLRPGRDHGRRRHGCRLVLASNMVSSAADAWIDFTAWARRRRRSVDVAATDTASITATTALDAEVTPTNDAGAGILNGLRGRHPRRLQFTSHSGTQAGVFGDGCAPTTAPLQVHGCGPHARPRRRGHGRTTPTRPLEAAERDEPAQRRRRRTPRCRRSAPSSTTTD